MYPRSIRSISATHRNHNRHVTTRIDWLKDFTLDYLLPVVHPGGTLYFTSLPEVHVVCAILPPLGIRQASWYNKYGAQSKRLLRRAFTFESAIVILQDLERSSIRERNFKPHPSPLFSRDEYHGNRMTLGLIRRLVHAGIDGILPTECSSD